MPVLIILRDFLAEVRLGFSVSDSNGVHTYSLCDECDNDTHFVAILLMAMYFRIESEVFRGRSKGLLEGARCMGVIGVVPWYRLYQMMV